MGDAAVAKSIVDAGGSEVLATCTMVAGRAWAMSRGIDANGKVRSSPQVDASGGRGIPALNVMPLKVDDDDDDDEIDYAGLMNAYEGGGATGKCACRNCVFPVWPDDHGWCDFCFGNVGGECACDCDGCMDDESHDSGECSHATVRMMAKSAARSGKVEGSKKALCR